MKASSKHILIISYVFPPYPGIGGRRWAKFAKYLSLKGYQVHVICARSPFENGSLWSADVDEIPAIITYPISPKYPAALLKQPVTITEKLRYRFHDIRLKWLARGNSYERALFWKKVMLKKAAELIGKYGIKNIIVSGGPFYSMHHALALKKMFHGINLIIDFRDQWTDNISFGGYTRLSQKKMDHEKDLELEVLEKADHIITVADKMTEQLEKKTPGNNKKFHTIYNGYDPDDFSGLSPCVKDTAKIKFVFTGNLYNEIEQIVFPFLDMIIEMKDKNKELYDRLSFSFIGTVPAKYERFALENEIDIIKFRSSVPVKEVAMEIACADYGMLFLNDDHTFSMSTKFMEYLGMKRSIVVVSKTGKLQEYVENNRIGYACRPETIREDFLRIVKEHERHGPLFSSTFDRGAFSIKELTCTLEELFI